MELLESLGIEWKLLLAQIINFVVLIFLLKKFAYGPIINLLENRRQKIEQGLHQAEESEKKLAEVEKRVKVIEEAAYIEAKQIINKAKAQASQETAEAIRLAGKQAEKIVAGAKAEAEQVRDKALFEARQHIAQLISLAIEKVIGQQLDDQTKEKLTTKAVEEL